MELFGRRGSHYTRVALLLAHELGVPVDLVVVDDLASTDPTRYGGNPTLKIPTLRHGDVLVFGTENICRTLAEHAASPARILWPERLVEPIARNAQELVWHGMAAEVQLVFGTRITKLPADHLYFVKGRAGFLGALAWLETNLPTVLFSLPPRDVSLLEITLFCLLEHIQFRSTVPLEPYPTLVRFAATFGARPSAQATFYRTDP